MYLIILPHRCSKYLLFEEILPLFRFFVLTFCCLGRLLIYNIIALRLASLPIVNGNNLTSFKQANTKSHFMLYISRARKRLIAA